MNWVFNNKQSRLCAAFGMLLLFAVDTRVDGQPIAPTAEPLLRDRDPLLPDAFNPPQSLVFTTPVVPAFTRFLGPVRPADEIVADTPSVEVQTEGVQVIDSNDADRDGYVEYYNGGVYVAELKQQGLIDGDSGLLKFNGVVREQYITTFTGQKSPHLLLRVQRDGGKHALVDAGPAAALKKLDIRNGDPLRVVARLGLINDRPALIAEQVTHESTTVKVVRTPSAG
jgi:hypothetical protein